jgi:hypothetical protein
MKMAVSFEGLDRLQNAIKSIDSPEKKTAMGRTMYANATAILNESKELVPVDTAALKDSGRVELPNVSPDGISVEITYGGAAAPYALFVHEDMTMDHSPSKPTAVTGRPRRGQAKFLEIPVTENAEKFFKRVYGEYMLMIKRGF